MVTKQKTSITAIEKFLDSDDEFPDNYFEKPKVPAYLDDDRFKDIEFSWIRNDNYVLPNNESNVNKEEPIDIVEIESKKNSEQNKDNKSILKGMLNKCDILCLKSVEKTMSNDNLLWFATYMMNKDIQSRYITTRLSSCLISEPVRISICKQESTVNKYYKCHKQRCTYRVIISKE